MNHKWKRRDFIKHTAMSALVAPLAHFWSDLAEANTSKTFMVLVFIPNGNGATHADTFATGSGSQFAFSSTYAALTPFKEDLIVLKNYGFRNLIYDNYTGDHREHHGGSCGLFSAAPPANNHYETGPRAPTIDQIVAWDLLKRGAINDPLRKTLPIRIDGSSWPLDSVFFQVPAGYDLNKTYSSEMTKASALLRPIDGFDRMFGDLDLSGSQTLEELWARGNSVLDISAQEVASIKNLLPSEGKAILEQHLEHIRSLEKSLESSSTPIDPDLVTRPPVTAVNSANHEVIWRQWIQVMNAALRADRTRVITIQFGGASSRFSIAGIELPKIIDPADGQIGNDHHTYSHVDNDGTRKFVKWYNERLAEFFTLLRGGDGNANIVGDGVVMVGSESGAAHNLHEIPVFLYGQAGGYLKTNQLINFNNQTQNHSGTLLTLCKAMGVSGLNSVGLPGAPYQGGEILAMKA